MPTPYWGGCCLSCCAAAAAPHERQPARGAMCCSSVAVGDLCPARHDVYQKVCFLTLEIKHEASVHSAESDRTSAHTSTDHSDTLKMSA